MAMSGKCIHNRYQGIVEIFSWIKLKTLVIFKLLKLHGGLEGLVRVMKLRLMFFLMAK